MTDPDAHARHVAQALLDALDTPEDPNQAALEAQKDRKQSEVAFASHVLDGKATPAQRPAYGGPARSVTEMVFAAGLEACPHCGSRRSSELSLHGSGTRWELRGTCSYCEKARTFVYDTVGDPSVPSAPYELGDGPSAMLSTRQLLSELEWLAPVIAPQPASLKPLAWRTSAAANLRSLTCLAELRKLQDPGVDPAWLDREWQRHLALEVSHEAVRVRNEAEIKSRDLR